MKAPETLQRAITYFSDADRCFQYALKLRFPSGVVSCPRCASEEHSFITTRRIWFCKGCRQQFSLKIGTIFEDSPLGLDKWMCAFWMICNCRSEVSSCEVARSIGITQKSAWSMLHRIRKAMHDDFAGVGVETDKTLTGVKVRNIPAGRDKRHIVGTGDRDKAAVKGLPRRSGKVRAAEMGSYMALRLQVKP